MYNTQEIIDNRYEVKNILMGGMGIVYVCFDLETQNFIALKTIQDGLARSMSGMERFVREASTWISLGKNTHIVYAERIQLIQGRPYIFMEYIPPPNSKYDSSLRGRILQGGGDIEFALDIMIQLCEGLSYAQTKIPGIVHRDLKPENILITTDDVAKVSDFGLVTSLVEDLEQILPAEENLDFFQTNITRSGRIVGTPPYMSPEQCLGSQLDIHSDIYALGCIFFELLTRQWLFASNKPKEWINWHVHKSPSRPSSHNRQVPASIDSIVLRCLQKSPSDRYGSYDELKEQLKNAYKQITGEYFIGINDGSGNSQQTEMNIVRSYVAIEDYSNALKSLDNILRNDTQNVDALVSKGACLMATHKDDDALENLERAIILDPNSVRAKINIGTLKIKLSNYNEALEYLSDAVKQDPSRWEAWNNLGIAYEMVEESEKALDCYDKSIEITPWQSSAWQNKARVLQKRGDVEQSKLCYKNAFNFAISHQTRSDIAAELLAERDFQDDEFFNSALRSIQKSPIPNLGKAAFGIPGINIFEDLFKYIFNDKRVNRSYARISRSLSLISQQASIHREHGKAGWVDLLNRGYSDIEEWEKENLHILPVNIRKQVMTFMYFMLASGFVRRDSFDVAGNVLFKAIEIDPQDELCRLLYGVCLFQSGLWSKSLTYLENTPDNVLLSLEISRVELNQIIDIAKTQVRM